MNKIDLLFIVDVTGSMGGFINDAKCKMQNMLTSLCQETNSYNNNNGLLLPTIDLKVGLSVYRDHPSQEETFVTVTFDLNNVETISDTISKITVRGGGDIPEAVIDGIIDGINNMSWREDSRRIAFLIGDAPAHGMMSYEDCCLCGKTWGDAINVAQEKNVIIYAISLIVNKYTSLCFKTLANFTGGILIEDTDAMNAIVKTLKSEFDNINLDSKILDMLSKGRTEDEISGLLKIDRDDVVVSKSRIAQY
jgi:hypothetical protein